MYDTQMNRITSRVSFGRDYSGLTAPGIITRVLDADEAAALYPRRPARRPFWKRSPTP